MADKFVHDCGVQLEPGDHNTYYTREKRMEGYRKTFVEYVGECPVCGGELDGGYRK